MAPQGFADKVAFVWKVADKLRGTFKQHEYGSVMLPLLVLRRMDAVLELTKQAVLDKAQGMKDIGPGEVMILKGVAQQRFFNSSPLTFASMLNDDKNLADQLAGYIRRLSPDAYVVMEAYNFDAKIERMDRAGILYGVLSDFADLDLRPEVVSNEAMGYIFEELLRKFSEMSNETAGEHYTPREVIDLMVHLMLTGKTLGELTENPKPVRTVYDPAAGTGGMLMGALHGIETLNPGALVKVYGQELNDETWAIAQSDLMMQGIDPKQMANGNSLTQDAFATDKFDFILANPPYGVDWKSYAAPIKDEHAKLGFNGRFGAGLPRVSDGSLLFLQHMLSKMKPGGSRVGIVLSGSPLFSGQAGSGESEIRRWILENDWLEGIVGLPDQMFYNTGISTYVWILTNDKADADRGKVKLIDARELGTKMRKSLGDKRKELTPDAIAEIARLYGGALDEYADDPRVRVLDRESFGFQRITVERAHSGCRACRDPSGGRACRDPGAEAILETPEARPEAPRPGERAPPRRLPRPRRRRARQGLGRGRRGAPGERDPPVRARRLDRPLQDEARLRDPVHPAVLRVHTATTRRGDRRRDQGARVPDRGLDEGVGHMRTVPLRYLVALNRSVLPDDTQPDFKFRYIDISQVTSTGEVVMPGTFTQFADAPSRARRLAQPGDTVVSTIRTYLRAIAAVPHSADPLVFSTGFAVLSPTGVDGRFLTYACRSEAFVGQVVSQSVGVSYPAINASELLSIPITVPAHDEQRRIADFLDDRVARIDQIIAARREQIELLDEQLTSAIARELQGLPLAPLRRLAPEIFVGIVIQPSRLYTDDPDGIPALRGVNVREGFFHLNDLVRITPEGNAANPRSRLQAGDVVVVRTGAAGAAAVVTEAMSGWNCIDLVVVRQSEALLPDFLAEALNGSRRFAVIEAASSGSIQQHFGVGALAEHQIPAVPLERQVQLVKAVAAARERAAQATEAMARSIDLLTEYKTSLITAAVTGELDVATAGSGIPA